MKHVSSSASQITTQTLSAYREANKNAEKAQAGSTASGTSLNRSDVTVSQQAYSQAKFDSYETMDRNALKKRGIELLDQLFIAGSKKANAEVPNSDDPVRLARAKQATVFCQNPSNDSVNPFLGLPREDLTKIIYDDSGAYTVNERSAALSEQQRQHYNYWSPIIDDAFMSGDYRKLYRSAIEYHDKLSSIEKSFAPAGYRANLVGWLEDEERKFGKLDGAANALLPASIHSNADKQKSVQELSSVYSWLGGAPKVSEARNFWGKTLDWSAESSIFKVTWNNVVGNVKRFFQ
ncbi:hypothetical protein [Rivihabitans pingtungensis]|uniref:hypothetical protein n=1 Tax=Rivihabitans pingtungensis TaxID=1054498 RepID=UPI002352FD85|nr:hypothetical protein [Rivihabitans pingtungensis]MCK6437782.1 hypothetical protein [Rivihabitans pingtungensis]